MQWLSTVDGSFEKYVERYRPRIIEMNQPFSGKVGRLLSSVDPFRGAELATLLQIDALFPKRFDTCSSGEQQIVRVAHALVDRPDSIVLIEPFRHLDQFRREHLQMLLRRISGLGVRIGYTERAHEQSGDVTFTFTESHLKPTIEAKDISYRHPFQAVYAIEDVTIQMNEPGLTVCVGTNGSGKSTLLELLAKSRRPLKGRVKRGERAVYLPAEPEYGPFPKEERRRVAQLQAVLRDPSSVLLLDEPTVDLTSRERKAFVETVRQKAETARVVCATHDMELIERATDVLYLASGRVVFEGERSLFQERSTLWSHTSSLS
ncbi:ATP-binding cassette domain-containing protein [Exiguobacterium qingdaonense]|uniref:ATP-binding cassette domain-containing protein n=1 Tax=Exiguobacterium qingdaonense TaxID=2751251 RepID=UPI001BE95378|nr:ATP-binding cassette domain-containing protein [Exiguobacterium qingdaonense]